MPRCIGLIAGLGLFPFEVARAVRRRGDRVVAAGIVGLTDPALEAEVDALHWFQLGQMQAFIDSFLAAGVSQAIMAGKVPKSFLYTGTSELELDALALELLGGLADRKDDSLLGVFADVVERAGVTLYGQAELTPELCAGEGVLGGLAPSAEVLADVAFAWPIAKAVAGLDIGQSVVVKRGAVLAVEAIEGTDATIARGGELGGGEVVVVKVAKPAQDPRFDVPVIGVETIECLARARAVALAVEAGHTVVLERERVVARADAEGIVLLGVAPDGTLSALEAP